VEIEYDAAKNERNVVLRGLSFDMVNEFDFSTALSAEQIREGQSQQRWVAIGFIDERLHVLVYTFRGSALRVISLRKANKREVKRYDQAQAKS
jgi:uncharacterized DUF497 family protein